MAKTPEINGVGIDFWHSPILQTRWESLKHKGFTRFSGRTIDIAKSHLADGKADLIAFGRPFIANPDLVERLQSGAPLAAINPATIYGGGAAGYTDYPRFTETSGN